MAYADGDSDLIDISNHLGVSSFLLIDIVKVLLEKELIERKRREE